MHFFKPCLLASLLALGACGNPPMPPMGPTAQPSVTMRGTGYMSARLSGASEVPPVVTAGSGTLEAELDTKTRLLSWTLNIGGLSAPATAAHFHGPAMPGSNAGVLVPIAGAGGSPIQGSATITEAQAADLMAGKWYVNVHTAANPAGEIRGQVNVRP